MARKLNSIISFFCIAFSFGQIDVKFINHLTNEGLVKEHKTYLNSLNPTSDSVYYFKAKFYLKYSNDSLFITNYNKSKLLCETDSTILKCASSYFLNGNNMANTTHWFDSVIKNVGDDNFNLVYKASVFPKAYVKENFPLELQKSFSKYKSAYAKKPLVAAFFSTILPGSGKLYAGKSKTFFLTFLLNAAYGVQTGESIQKLGVKNPLSIINASAFTVFYLSNIYGSYKAVIDLRKERKKQFIKDATNFYN